MLDLDKLGFSLIPGPLTPPEPLWSSLDLKDIQAYDPARVASVLLSLPGAILLSDGGGDWHKWNAAWDLAGATIGVGFSLFEIDPVAWGGSDLSGMVGAHALLDAWLHVREALPCVWLHDGECDIYTPDAFRARFLG